jgi:hypothetical protein
MTFTKDVISSAVPEAGGYLRAQAGERMETFNS